MSRPTFVACILALATFLSSGASADEHLVAPRSGTIKVAFVLSEGATVIDFAGPWDVFESVVLGDDRPTEQTNPFELYTVGPSKTPIHTSGSHRPGLMITPEYDFSDAPRPDIVVIGAQSGGPGLSEWLQKAHAQDRIIMSVCTGAFKLGKAGLLQSKSATTHHSFFDKFAAQNPGTTLVRGVRFVQADPILYTAGGEVSGMDLALHLVEGYFGTAAAQQTADRMEYQGTGWRTNVGVTAVDPPSHEEWSGKLASGAVVSVRITIQGPKLSAVADSPALGISGAPTTINVEGSTVRMTFGEAGESPTFIATDNDADDTLTGTLTIKGKASALTLHKVFRPHASS